MLNKIDSSKSTWSKRWGEFFDQFPVGNCRYHISLKSIGSELSNEKLIQNAPLVTIIYARLGKGHDLVFEVGQDQVTYTHTINSPTEVLMGQNPDG